MVAVSGSFEVVRPPRVRGGLRVAGTLLLGAVTACVGSANGEGVATDGPASSSEAGAAGTQEGQVASLNTLTAEEREAGWELLFDGVSLDGWRGYNRPDLPGGWEAQDGMLVRTGPGGDIITDRTFADFELTVEWRVGEAGNSGIFYRAAEGEEWIYHSAPEFQVLDDANHRDGQDPITSAGSNYALHPAPRGIVRPAGEWNEARIVVQGDRVEHWLNGTHTVEYDFGSDDWEQRVANSKFVEWPAYGRAERGHIGLQDHGDLVWFRNLKIRVIE